MITSSRQKLQSLNDKTIRSDTGPLISNRESEKDPLQDLVDLKREHPNQQLLLHLNINSLPNKFDELKVINAELKAGIIVLTIQRSILPTPMHSSVSWTIRSITRIGQRVVEEF